MAIDFEYRPLPVHVPFHQSAAYERAMFGAFGSGKTYAVVSEGIAWCLEQPGIRGLFARKTAMELRDTLEPIFLEMLPPELLNAGTIRRTGGHIESFTFPNGSKVLFRGLDDWNKHRSLNVGFIAYDEMNEIDEETYQGMASRVRQRDITAEAKALGYTHEITRRGIWGATNPSGHDWMYDRFVNKDSPQYSHGSVYFKSTSLDNPYLPPEYVESLLAYPEPWVKRYVLCQFDDFAGQIYENWNWDDHVIEPYKDYRYPDGAGFWMGMDPGTDSPTAGLWVVVDRSTRSLIAVAEYEESGINVDRHTAAWRQIEASQKIQTSWRVADPNSMPVRDRGTSMSLRDLYAKRGFYFDLGPSRYPDRIPLLGTLVDLRRFKATKNCPRFFEQMKNYRWEDLTPSQRSKGIKFVERPLKKDDHLVDCGQYLSSRMVGPIKTFGNPSLDDKQAMNAEIHTAIKKQMQTKQRRRTNRRNTRNVGRV